MTTPNDAKEFDTINDSWVAVQAGQIVIMRQRPKLTKPEALRLAAWLVALADDEDEFMGLLDAVRGT